MGFSDIFKKVVDPFGIVTGGDKSNIPTPVDPLAVATKGKNKGTSLAGRQATSLFGNYYPSVFPQVLGLQEKYTPQFMEQAFGFGQQATTGFQALQDAAALQAAKSMAGLRAEELGTMGTQAPLTRGIMESLSPEQAAAVQASAQEAERARAASMGVTPQERRSYEQQAREGFQASGRLGGNAALVAEAMGRENVMAKKREEAAQAGQRAYGMAGGFYTQPGLELLRQTPAAYGAGAKLAGIGMEYGQTLGPQLDYNMPLNFAQQRAGALDKYNMANYEAEQKRKAEQLGLIKNIASVAAAPFTGGASLAFMGQ